MSLEREVRRRQERMGIKGQLQQLHHTLELKDAQIQYERLQRVAAQRGLVIYVRALESLGNWLAEHPNPEFEIALRDRGLYGIKLGYDPDQDPEVMHLVSR